MKNCKFCEGLISERAKKCKYCGEWVDGNNSSKEETDSKKEKEIKKSSNYLNSSEPSTNISTEKVKIGLKTHLINLSVHIIYILLTLVISFLYTLSDKQDLINEGNYSDFFSSMLGSFLVIFFLGNYLYRKGRGKLSGDFKKDLLSMGKGTIGMFILLLLYFYLYHSNISINNKETYDDVSNLANSFSELAENYDGNIDYSSDFQNILDDVETDSYLGNSIKDYLTELQSINTNYNDSINGIGELLVDSVNYNNITVINNTIDNLSKLGETTQIYVDDRKILEKKYPQLEGMISNEGNAELRKSREIYIEAEKKFIKDSTRTYKYLLEIQEYIEVSDGEIGIYNDAVREEFNSSIEVMNVSLIEYQERENELLEVRQKLVDDNMNTLKENNEEINY